MVIPMMGRINQLKLITIEKESRNFLYVAINVAHQTPL